jgi:glutathione S-transferase
MSLKHLKPIKFYSMATPNGVKVSTFLEELRIAYELPYECVSRLWPARVDPPIDHTSFPSTEEIHVGTNRQKEPWFLKIASAPYKPGFCFY